MISNKITAQSGMHLIGAILDNTTRQMGRAIRPFVSPVVVSISTGSSHLRYSQQVDPQLL